MARPLVPLVIGAMVLVAACSSDDDAPSAGSSSPIPGVTESTDADALDDATTTAPPALSAPESPPAATDAAGPLVEPAVSLFEVGTFDQPVEIAVRPGDIQLFVVEQPGRVVAVNDLASEVLLDVTDLTEASGEQGLLGLAFHPTDDLAYINYIDGSGDTVVAELAVDPLTGEFDRDSLREVLTVDQPFGNHNGGELAFGPDQLLYIGLGDGGSRDDPQRTALDLGSRLGKILRIDPRAAGSEPFAIPPDNPFVGQAGADPTIWSFGLRNPWRFSFDPVTGDLWIADVGQGEFEEVNHAPATNRADAGRGINFGWSAFEGFERFNDDQPPEGATAPVYVYDHSNGRCSVSGGAVARNSPVANLDGWYVFGDYCSGEIWALDPAASPDAPRVVDLGELSGLAAVVAGPEGELYAVSNAGTVARFQAP